MELRHYQVSAINSLYRYFEKHQGNPLIVLPTGTGKSVCIGEFVRGAIDSWHDTRVVMLTHVRELIQQNFQELIRLWPSAPAGIYSAGLNSRDLQSQIVFAGIQSIHSRAERLGQVDLILVDEAHLIPRKTSTMYQRFLSEVKALNPHVKIVGFTATPYRLDTGMLHEGKGALFSDIAYDYSIADAIAEGFLSQPVTKDTKMHLDTTGVAKRGGEFVAGALERAVNKDDLNRRAVEEIIERGSDRKSWLAFCSGVEHAAAIADLISDHGISVATITGDTPTGERDRIINDFKAGRIRCLTNANVLTTGFNAPAVDLIALLRPTQSVGLYVQMVGRGTRLAPGKTNCLVLDFAQNIETHGPIDCLDVEGKGAADGEGGEAPTKTCPVEVCRTILPISVMECPECGHVFPEPEAKIQQTASASAILSTQIEPEWVRVKSTHYFRHEKQDKPPTLRVEYWTGWQTYREWICFEHKGFARQKAVRWWFRRMGSDVPVPNTVAEALALAKSLPEPTRVQVKPVGKFTEVTGHDFDPVEQLEAAE